MKEIGAQLLVRTIQGIEEGILEEISQENIQFPILNVLSSMENPPAEASHSPLTIAHSPLKHAPKIFPETSRINWSKTVDEIHNLIRGLSPYPGAYTELGDKMIKIFRSSKEPAVPTSKIGRWESDGKTWLKFAAKDGYIHFNEVQLEGKKRMMIEDFLRGYRF
jgi:methionyl-tRNA formyltransferase